MYFYSTNNKELQISFREAVIRGIAPDGGLFMPGHFPDLSQFLATHDLSFHQIAEKITGCFIDDLNSTGIKELVSGAFDFDVPLVDIGDNNRILELFHGPTLAFKDFGARFLARILAGYVAGEDKKVIILVATSGDTGSAVASGFFGIDGIEVALLYPSQKVSELQEKQLTTMGGNIRAFEVAGTFDDCQTLVKQAFMDEELRAKFNLSSANSINIARLLPQSFYYCHAANRLRTQGINDLVFNVPSGNFGNLTAGLFAERMGIPVKKFIASVNENSVFRDYLRSGAFTPRPAVKTLSNAMDVGNPSNFYRITDMFGNDLEKIRSRIFSARVSDDQTIDMIKKVYERSGYIIDPHGAVGLRAAEEFRKQYNYRGTIVTLETAHPAKFSDTIRTALNIEVDIPERLARAVSGQKRSTPISTDFKAFKSELFKID